MDDDVEGSLKKVAEIGFKEIESAYSKKPGYYGMKPKEFKSFLERFGLNMDIAPRTGRTIQNAGKCKTNAGCERQSRLPFPPMRNLRDNYAGTGR